MLREAEARLGMTSLSQDGGDDDAGDAGGGDATHRGNGSGGEHQLIVRRDGDGSINVRRMFNLPVRKNEPRDYIARAALAALWAHRHKCSMEEARRTIRNAGYKDYGDDPIKAFCEYIAKAASAPAMTTVTGWAAELVQLIYADFMATLMPLSVFPRLSQLGLALSFGRAGRISVPTRNRTPTIAGSFVGEGAPIPVRQGQFMAQILTPKKMGVITVWTRELDESSIPAIEGLLRQAIDEDTAVSLDSVLLDAMPATQIRPAGLLNGVTPLTPTPAPATPIAGAGFDTLVGDLRQVAATLLNATHGNVRTPCWIMNPIETMAMSLTHTAMGTFPFKDDVEAGTLLRWPIIDSATVPMGTMLAVDAADFVTVGGEAPRFEVSDQATLHMEDTSPQAIVDGGPASPVRSLWQTDSLGLRMILPVNWTMRRPGMVAWLQGATWGQQLAQQAQARAAHA